MGERGERMEIMLHNPHPCLRRSRGRQAAISLSAVPAQAGQEERGFPLDWAGLHGWTWIYLPLLRDEFDGVVALC